MRLWIGPILIQWGWGWGLRVAHFNVPLGRERWAWVSWRSPHIGWDTHLIDDPSYRETYR